MDLGSCALSVISLSTCAYFAVRSSIVDLSFSVMTPLCSASIPNDYTLSSHLCALLLFLTISHLLQVISISYSISEHFLTFYEVVIFDIEATKLLVQGVTILAAAGDAGVTGDGLGHAFCGYNPVFPASSIYVTAVGGTQGTPKIPDLGPRP